MLRPPDYSLIQPLTDENNTLGEYNVVVADFEHAGRELCFVGVQHGAGVNHPVYDIIKLAVSHFNPDVIILEARDGSDCSGFVTHVKEQAKTNFKNSSEICFTAHFALEGNIPFLGGEPSDKAIIGGMQDKGYLSQDVLAFYLSHLQN